MSVDIIGVPMDLGANRRGVDMGPSAIRYAGLKSAVLQLGLEYNDLGNINVQVPENYTEDTGEKMKYVEEINRANEALSKIVGRSVSEGNMPIVLGGDHSIAIGSVIGTQNVLGNIGLIWIDAHGDYNTELTTLSGNLHGMSLAACTGAGALEATSFKKPEVRYIDPEKTVLIGVRNLDTAEGEALSRSGITVFTMADIDMHGMKDIITKALDIVENGTEGFHLSFDLDAMNPAEAPGVGTPVKGGLTYREAHLAAEMISDSKKLRSAEFVELNPIMDKSNQTGELAVSLICSVLGQKILRNGRS
ncbi:MAG: arginase [Clostridiales bacterium]|nr:arginase [Clostridiales bacterium]